MQCRAYAKALHYKEEEFHKGPTSQVLEALISINNKLQQKEAAMGWLSIFCKNETYCYQRYYFVVQIKLSVPTVNVNFITKSKDFRFTCFGDENKILVLI